MINHKPHVRFVAPTVVMMKIYLLRQGDINYM